MLYTTDMISNSVTQSPTANTHNIVAHRRTHMCDKQLGNYEGIVERVVERIVERVVESSVEALSQCLCTLVSRKSSQTGRGAC